MAKGHQAHKERQELVQSFGKTIGKRAGFACEWCEGKDELRLWDYRPDQEPTEENLALLCVHCRQLAEGPVHETNRLHAIRNALWSNVPAISEGAARVLGRAREPWAREAIEESLIDEEVKREILGR